MAGLDFAAWLFVQGIAREKWAMSPGPSIVAGYKGKQVDEIYVPGILLGFPSTKAAAKAAMRFHFDLAQMFGNELPPMVIDSGGNPRNLPTIAYGRDPKLVILTSEAARQLAGEPIDLTAGPELNLEGMKGAKSKLMPPSEHNIGWALPAVQIEVKGAYPQNAAPSILSGTGAPEFSSSPQRPIEWPSTGKTLRFSGAFLLLLFSGFFFWNRLAPSLKPQEPPPQATERALSTQELLKPLPYFITPTPVPAGFGSVVIHYEPKNSKVFVDNQLLAKKSPITLDKESDQAVHKLIVEKKGYKTYTKIFNVEANQRLVLHVKLEKGE
jgi:hypothetical protein